MDVGLARVSMMTHTCPEQPVVKGPLQSTGAASRLAAVLLGRILPVCSLVAPYQTGASPLSVRRGTVTTDCQERTMRHLPTTRYTGAGACRALVLAAVALLAEPVGVHTQAPATLDIYWIDVEGGAATLVVTP